jgi:hypothetical protein
MTDIDLSTPRKRLDYLNLHEAKLKEAEFMRDYMRGCSTWTLFGMILLLIAYVGSLLWLAVIGFLFAGYNSFLFCANIKKTHRLLVFHRKVMNRLEESKKQ